MKLAIVSTVLVLAVTPALASSTRGHSHISSELCAMVRNVVAQFGVTQAKAMARERGMTTTQQKQAETCLAQR